ncbi:biotin--[acetyl-CoA-carboxylase] ligase [Gramella sp. GC03-9]|uniref:Biotin--[acetyl-CoA-carboxylase] ligase n=1 Tax=Christiangramia oceanisediminis TaxID=2920386 RepID=A0A9X2L034_9FLAO|nr:biotin--[acetyl-CoA-carboxylase] ligase [Gramella oceanisediminis]MCP9201394.1 biotin--[acetyl-CoA-carboxylase] ligase [Gramella oceanisediminis]
MRIIKVNAIDSTNSLARKFYEGKRDFEPVCIRAISQTNGRGQRGANWLSKPGDNLTFSILYPQKKLNISRHFLLSASVALAVHRGLKAEGIPDLKLKWPNDILSAKFKIGGILIENIIKAEDIVASIIGVGINVNQQDFEGLPQASSIFKITGKHYDLDSLLERIVERIEENLEKLSSASEASILEEYVKNMFRLDKVSVFSTAKDSHFNGIIRGVTMEGKLNVEIEEGVFKTFHLKEIQLHY